MAPTMPRAVGPRQRAPSAASDVWDVSHVGGTRRSSTIRIIALALTLALAACGDDNFSPTVETVAGPYTASTFTYETSEGTTDLLAAGAVVAIDLADDGTTTGE